LKANPSLQAAQALLREADENTSAEKGYYYPSVVRRVGAASASTFLSCNPEAARDSIAEPAFAAR
jgi:outer membrane protein TolC